MKSKRTRGGVAMFKGGREGRQAWNKTLKEERILTAPMHAGKKRSVSHPESRSGMSRWELVGWASRLFGCEWNLLSIMFLRDPLVLQNECLPTILCLSWRLKQVSSLIAFRDHGCSRREQKLALPWLHLVLILLLLRLSSLGIASVSSLQSMPSESRNTGSRVG